MGPDHESDQEKERFLQIFLWKAAVFDGICIVALYSYHMEDKTFKFLFSF